MKQNLLDIQYKESLHMEFQIRGLEISQIFFSFDQLSIVSPNLERTLLLPDMVMPMINYQKKPIFVLYVKNLLDQFENQSPIANYIHNSKVMFVLSVHWNLKLLLNLEIIEPNYVPSQKKPRRKLRKIPSKIFHQQTVKVTKLHSIISFL